jgi:hypothetical protein
LWIGLRNTSCHRVRSCCRRFGDTPTGSATLQLEEGVAYTVTGSVENVYASLVALMGYTNTFTRTNQWKDQARYEVGKGMVCVFRHEAEGHGELQFVLGAAEPMSQRRCGRCSRACSRASLAVEI